MDDLRSFPMFLAQGDEILKGLDEISGWVKTWAIPLAAIGAVSMAVLQIAKNVFPLRSWFQRRHLCQWLSARNPEKAQAGVAVADLIVLAAAGDSASFYDSPIEQLSGQIKGAVPVILDYPKLHRDLLFCLASEADEEDLERLLNPPAPELFLKGAHQSTQEDKHEIAQFAAAKNRVGAQVRCSIDAIQASISFRWKYWLQIASIVSSALIGIVALYAGATPEHAPPTIEAAVIIGIISGTLAPVARDLIAAVEKWRS
jgi:hypothetical protein